MRHDGIEGLGNVQYLAEAVLGADDLLLEGFFVLKRFLVQIHRKAEFILKQTALRLNGLTTILVLEVNVAAQTADQEEQNEGEPVGGLIEQGQGVGAGFNS